MTQATAAPTRRERQRQATFDEIVEVSRRLLREGQDVSVRAVASEMGLTPPALYRYVDSHSELMALTARSVFADVVAAMTRARDAQSADDPAGQIVAASAAFRAWALGNREEFQLVFASASTSDVDPAADPTHTAADPEPSITSLDGCLPSGTGVDQFGAFFSEIFGRLWGRYRFTLPSDDELDPEVLQVLTMQIKPDAVIEGFGAVTPGMIWVFERAWAQLYGTVTLEVFGHVHPAFISSGALFRAAMRDIGRQLGLEPEWDRLQEVARSLG